MAFKSNTYAMLLIYFISFAVPRLSDNGIALIASQDMH
jgi:hypothetical protein